MSINELLHPFRRSAVALVLLGSVVVQGSVLAAEAGSQERDSALFRITPSQYKNIVTDLFGAANMGGRFEPGIRDDGLLALGAGRVSVTSVGFEQYDDIARSIATDVLSEQKRALLLTCQPKSPTQADDDCARQFIARIGTGLYRRPLTDVELKAQVRIAAATSNTLKDFYAGLKASLVNMLDSANFLFRQRRFEADPERPGLVRLDAYSKASQLSFFLWDTGPDEELLEAARTGALHTQKGLAEQVDRLIRSPRVESGIRAFFSDMLGFDLFSTIEKDPTAYPNFTVAAKSDAQEQTLRTIVDHVLNQDGDYRDLFTTRKTFLTQSLAALYGVPLIETSANGAPDRWTPHTYAEGDPRVGILTHASFVALHSHAARTSPTIRGKAVRENLLCQAVPPPPGNVDFTLVQGTDPRFKTARERLTAHSTNPVCAGCHKITDPIGLALENFDTAGGYRRTENGAPIDASGRLGNNQYTDVRGLSLAMHDDPAVPSCVAKRIFASGAGHLPPSKNPQWLEVTSGFERDGYRLLGLLRQVATSELFYAPASPQTLVANKPGATGVQQEARP